MKARLSVPARWPLWLALVWLAGVVVSALAAPWLAPADPAAAQPALSLSPPSAAHLLGTDLLGRDSLSRLLWGARRTLGMAGLALLITAGGGALVGVAAAEAGRYWEEGVLRLLDVVLALPPLLVALVLVAGLGSGPWTVGLAVGLAGLAGFARLARSAVMQVRQQTYIQAAHALGMRRRDIVWRHLLPNIAGPLAALTVVHFAWSVLNTATLTFLGFGGSGTAPDWGLLLNEGRAYWASAPWISLAPGLAITLTVLSAQSLARLWDPSARLRAE